MRANELFNRHM